MPSAFSLQLVPQPHQTTTGPSPDRQLWCLQKLITASDGLDSAVPVATFSRLAIGAAEGDNVQPLLRHG